MTTKADHKAALLVAESFKDGTAPWSTLAAAYLERDRQLKELRGLVNEAYKRKAIEVDGALRAELGEE